VRPAGVVGGEEPLGQRERIVGITLVYGCEPRALTAAHAELVAVVVVDADMADLGAVGAIVDALGLGGNFGADALGEGGGLLSSGSIPRCCDAAVVGAVAASLGCAAGVGRAELGWSLGAGRAVAVRGLLGGLSVVARLVWLAW
jgi:hypothetical protein